MATGPSTPQASNVYIPNWEASGKLTVGFSRDPKRFKVAKYAQYIRTPKQTGYYLKFTNQEAGRVIDQNRYLWPDGANGPQPKDSESFTWKQFTAARYAYPYSAGYLAKQQADFNLMAAKREPMAARLMTARTMRMASLLTTTTNWATSTDPDLASNHYATATALGGGKFDAGTSTSPFIKNALNAAMDQITLDTMGVVISEPSQFMCVINPVTARKWAASPELQDYIKGSPQAWPMVTGNLHENSRYGLPSHLYGFEIVIEETVKVTNNKGGTLARSYAFPNATAVLLTRQGNLEGVYGEGSFSTATCMYYTEGADSGEGPDIVSGMDLAVEEFDDPRNKRWEGRVIENVKELLTCPASGFLITSTND